MQYYMLNVQHLNIYNKWQVLDNTHTFFEKVMSTKNKETPAASLKRRNMGWGLPIHRGIL